MKRLAFLTSGLTGAAAIPLTGALELVAALVAVLAGTAGFVWTWRDRREEKEARRLRNELLREQLHDVRKDGDNAAQ